MQHHSTTGEMPLETFLRELLLRNLDRVLMANQPGELPVCPTEDPGGTGGEVMCGIPEEPPIGVGREWEALVLSCSESVKVMAWKFARSSSRIEFDDMYSIGMLEICESVAAGRLARADNPMAYLCGAARFAMCEEWRRVHACSTISLDAPLSNDTEMSLLDILSAPALAAPASSTCVRPLHGAIGRLTSRQRGVLRRRYGLPGYGFYTEREAARSLRTTVDAVDIASRRGLRKLRADARLCEVVGVEVAR